VRVGSVPPDALSRMGLARVGQEQPKVGKYTVDVAGFESFALPALGEEPAELPENPRLYKKPDGTIEAVSLLDCQEPTEEEPTGSWLIQVPSTGQQEMVTDPSSLEPVPDGWKPPKAVVDKTPHGEHCPRLCVCDEVGKMALLSLKFGPQFLAALDGEAVILGTVPQPNRGQRDHEVVQQVKRRNDVKVARITRNNRDQLVPQVYAWLKESLGFGPPGSETRAAKRRRLDEEAEAAKKAAADSEARAAQAEKERQAIIAKKAAKADEKKAKKDEKKEKKAKKKEQERLEGLKRAAERKKRREGVLEAVKSTAKNPMEIDEEEEVEMVKTDPYGDPGAEDDVQAVGVPDSTEVDDVVVL